MNVSIRIAIWFWVRLRGLTLLRRAGGVFAKTRYAASIRDKWALAKNASKLEIGGIAGLNERLFSAKTNIFDTITEHNFGCMLLLKFAPPAKVSYEPSGHGPRPVDFCVHEDNTTFWFQMKRFSQLARENRRDKIFDVIKKEALRIEANKYFGISFHERFTEAHVESLLDLLAEASAAGFPEAEVTLVVDGGIVARVQSHTPTRVKLECLTLGYGADEEAVNITGLSTTQMRDGLRKSAGAFAYPADSENVNLLVAEANQQHDIDIANACFGTEYIWERVGGGGGWAREEDGVFREALFASHVVGLIVLRRMDKLVPISEYRMALYMNEPHIGLAERVQARLEISEAIRYNTNI